MPKPAPLAFTSEQAGRLTWLFRLIAHMAGFGQPLQVPTVTPVAGPVPPLQMFFMYHSCNGIKAIHRFSHAHGESKVVRARPLQLPHVLIDNCSSVFSQKLQRSPQFAGIPQHLSELAPGFGTSLGQRLQLALAENSGILAMGFHAQELASASCGDQRNCWLGSSSWKATGVKVNVPQCQNLEAMAYKQELAAQLASLPDDAAIFWMPVVQAVRHRNDPNPTRRHVRAVPALSPNLFREGNSGAGEGWAHKFFNDLMWPVNYTHDLEPLVLPSSCKTGWCAKQRAAFNHSSVMGQPWGNMFAARPSVLEALARAQVLFYAWMHSQKSFPEHGCSVLGWNAGTWGRCWAFFGEQLSLIFLTSFTRLYYVGCDRPTAYHAPGTHYSYNLTQYFRRRLRKAWDSVMAASPTAEEALYYAPDFLRDANLTKGWV